jgi:hypothetical protein
LRHSTSPGSLNFTGYFLMKGNANKEKNIEQLTDKSLRAGDKFMLLQYVQI